MFSIIYILTIEKIEKIIKEKISSVHQTFQHCLVESKKSAFIIKCPINNSALLTFL